jgi:hypothetical protein
LKQHGISIALAIIVALIYQAGFAYPAKRKLIGKRKSVTTKVVVESL